MWIYPRSSKQTNWKHRQAQLYKQILAWFNSEPAAALVQFWTSQWNGQVQFWTSSSAVHYINLCFFPPKFNANIHTNQVTLTYNTSATLNKSYTSIQYNSNQSRINTHTYKLQTIHDAINNPSIVGVEVEPYIWEFFGNSKYLNMNGICVFVKILG